MIYSFFDFMDRTAAEMKRTFVDLPYLHTLAEAVEDCVFGRLPDGKRNLAISIPPRHYKTTFVSQGFPAWALGEIAPDCEFILTSATAPLAISNAIEVYKIITQPFYQELYPHVQISKADKELQHYFKTTSTGSVYAAGLGGTITGFGAGKVRKGFGGAIVIDDPLKAADASSDAVRQSCIDYYSGTLKSRRNSVFNTPIILIMQRLHPEDLIGWVLQNEAKDWHLVSFPAVDVEGKLLNPITTSLDELKTLEEVAPAVYFSQYQQQPTTPGGNIIKKKWWKTFDPAKKFKTGIIYLTADTAFKKEQKGRRRDESVIRAWEACREGLFCLDAIYGKWEFPELLENAKVFWAKWADLGATEFWIEDKASGTPLVQMLLDAGVPADAWTPAMFDYPDDKVARMKAASWAVHGGKCFVPEGDHAVTIDETHELKVSLHGKVLIEQCADFSEDMSHTHDDHCDTFTQAHSLWLDAGGVV